MDHSEQCRVGRYISLRVLNAIPVVFVITLIVFTVTYLIPGDPAVIMLGREATPEAIEALRERMGLNEPFLVRYGIWLGNVVRGDLGESLISGQPVTQLIRDSLPVTLELSLFSLTVALLIAVPTAILSALKKGSAFDTIATVLAFLGISMPNFWLGIMLIVFFAVRLNWLPAAGYYAFEEGLTKNVGAMVLPSLALGIPMSTQLMRYLRTGVLRTMREDYVTTARMKGVPERQVVVKHIVKNALIPFVTALGFQVGYLLGGTVVIEEVFALPGMGRLAVGAISDRDYQVVQGVVLLVAVLFVLINILVDILYSVLDPRIRLGADVPVE